MGIKLWFKLGFASIMLKLGYVPKEFAPRKGWLWVPTQPNHLLRGEGFAVSYIPMNRDPMLPVEKRVGTKEKCETAIMFGDSPNDEEVHATYLVLNGDHREAYEQRVGDLSECIEYYRANKEEYGSYFSTDAEMERKEANG